DNSIIALGMRRYNALKELKRLCKGLFEASKFFPYNRLPELFCGFTRRGSGGPVFYPTACDPQAWAVGSLFLIIQSLLGLEVKNNSIHIKQPLLPPETKELEIRNLSVGGAYVDLAFEEREGKITCHLIKKKGNIKVIIEA
ncbi:MAG: amylo-alpha-1,6-glucosidase, partial [Clostridia bacterium]|nr:amylo-alpha-1,6-glucosidase [Clostridia bacterium]